MGTPPPSDRFIETVVRRLDAIPAVEMQGPPRWKQAPAAARVPRAGWAGRVRVAGIATSVACVVAAGIAVVIGLSGSSSVDRAEAALPVFKRPMIDATRVRPRTPELARQQARYADAREIVTANGPGYVMPAADGRVCLAVPDPVDGYGQSCASAEQIERRGLPVVLTSNRGGAMAAVVPKTASDAVLHLPDGTKKNLDIVDGVITAAATGKASVSFQVGARLVSVPLYSDTCVQVYKNQFNKNNTIPQDVRRAMAKSGMHLCGDDAPATRP